jgi:cold shock CspA family protein
MSRPTESVALSANALRRGIVAEPVAGAGLGFIEPGDRGGQLPMRASSIVTEHELQRGAAVEYSLADGSMGVEAVQVKACPLEDEGFAGGRHAGRAERRD